MSLCLPSSRQRAGPPLCPWRLGAARDPMDRRPPRPARRQGQVVGAGMEHATAPSGCQANTRRTVVVVVVVVVVVCCCVDLSFQCFNFELGGEEEARKT